MKKLKNIILAVVLAFAFCLPVFAFVGCDTTKNEEEQTEPTFATVATDMTTTFNGYLASLVEQHTALAKKYELDKKHNTEEEWEPEWEGDDQELFNNLADAIKNYWDSPWSWIIEDFVDFKNAEDGVLYLGFDSDFVTATKTENGFNLAISYSSRNEKRLEEYNIVYDGNKITKIDETHTSYFYYDDWEIFGLDGYGKMIYDFETNTAYTFYATARVPGKEIELEEGEVGGEALTSKEYWNGLEILLDAYNSGKFTQKIAQDLQNRNLTKDFEAHAERLDKLEINNDDNPLLSLRNMKKAGIEFNQAKLEDIPEYSIFDGEDLPELTREEFEAINDLRDKYVLRENGLFINDKELSLDYDATLDALTQVKEVVRDYVEWLENYPMVESIRDNTRGIEGYPDFPCKMYIDIDHIEYIDTMIDYLQNTEKSEWDGRLLFNVEVIMESIEIDGDEEKYYVDARPNMTEIDADGNHTYYLTLNDNWVYDGGEVFSFTLNAQGKVTRVELYEAQVQEMP